MKTEFLQATLLIISIPLILLGYFGAVFALPEWSLPVSGEVNNTLSLTMDELTALHPTTVQADIYCDGVFVTGGNWLGSRLSEILQMAELSSQAESVEFIAADGYQVTIPITIAIREDVIVAYQLNGEPLSEVLRLVIPEANGNAWIAGITQINVTSFPSDNPQAAFILPNFNTYTSNPTPTPTTTSSPKPTPTLVPPPTALPSSTASSYPTPSLSPDTQGFSLLSEVIYAAVGAVTITAIAGTALLVRRRQKVVELHN